MTKVVEDLTVSEEMFIQYFDLENVKDQSKSKVQKIG